MKKSIQIRVIFWFSIVILNVFVGFYFTYLSKYPTFEGITNVHHFHGLLNLLWLTILIVQPYLIYKKKLELHRKVGRLSYALMPILLLSIIMVLRVAYHRDMYTLPRHELLANVALGVPDFIILGTIYTLAILNTQHSDRHLRYMIGTSLMMLGPGLGRAITGLSNLSGDLGADVSNNITLAIAALCVVYDLYCKKSPVPFSIIFFLILCMKILFACRYSQMWQVIAAYVVELCF